MTPPDGAWMTRDGDVIEIGCHSGSKTWRLECKENQWVGSIGRCSTRDTQSSDTDKKNNEHVPKPEERQVLNVSPGKITTL